MGDSGGETNPAHARAGVAATKLVTSPNLRDADGFYAAFVAAHERLADEASELLNARLVLILANHIGDPAVLDEALRLARAPLAAKAGTTTELSR